MSLTALFVRRPTLAFVELALMLLLGFMGFRSLPVQLFPNVSQPTLTITATYSGASPTVMSSQIVSPIEDAIAGTPDLQTISSNIQSGTASVTAIFTITSDINTDLTLTQRAVQIAQRNLPSDVLPPTVSVRDPSEATVVTISLTSTKLTESQLSLIATGRVIPYIEQIPDISYVSSGGTLVPAYEVVLDPTKLASANLTINDVFTTVSGSNRLAPGGTVYGPNRDTLVTIRGDIYRPSSISGLPIPPPTGSATANTTTGSTTSTSSTSGNLVAANGPVDPWTSANEVLRVGDVATVVDGYEPRQTFASVGGMTGLFLSIQKTGTASEVTASENVLRALPAIEAQFPDITFGVVQVQARFTRQQIAGVIHTLIEAIILTGLVMLFFLASWRNAIIVCVAIPASLCVTLFVMSVLGLTLDTISLLGMTLVIGILVDDATVVLENVERHHVELGQPPDEAAISGRTEIGAAAVVITMVDVVVFLPIAFLQSQVGRNLEEFAIVVVISTLTSLFVSFTITPTLAAKWGLRGEWKPWWIIRAFTAGFEHIREVYVRSILPWGLRHAVPFVAACFASLVFAIALIPLGVVGETYIPAIYNGQVFIQVTYPVGTPLTKTTAAVLKIESLIRQQPDIASDTALSGGYSSPYGGLLVDMNIGQIQVFLVSNPSHPEAYWVTRYQQIASAAVPDANVLVIPSTGQTGGNAQPVDELVTDTTSGDPTAYAQKVYQALLHTPGATNVFSSAAGLEPQVEVYFDRARARALDVSIGTATTAASAAFGGAIATQFETNDGLEEVQVIYPIFEQTKLSSLAEVPIRASNGQIVHLGDFTTFRWQPTPPLITRVDRHNVVDVSANVGPNASLSGVQSALAQRVAALHLPKNIVVRPRPLGQQDLMHQTLQQLGGSLMLSIVLVFLLMVALYNSYTSPLVIMFAVPVAAVGATGALALTHQTLNLFSLIGTIMLVGIVTKNGILLVDYANTLRRRGVEKLIAIQESAGTRFRPILMTSVSVVAGNVPLALALEPGSQVRASLGIVVIGGILSSLSLTLILVPIMYMWMAPKHVTVEHAETPVHEGGGDGAPAAHPQPAHG